jgi:thioredoxin 1
VASERILELTDDNFDELIGQATGPVLVDFWASWCAPCKRIAPTLDELAEDMEGQARVAKVNVDDNGDLTNRFGIRSIPTLVLFKQGRVVDQKIGNVPKPELRAMIEKHLG